MKQACPKLRSAAAAEGSAERQRAGQAEGVRGAQEEELAETPLAPRVKKRIVAEEQSTAAEQQRQLYRNPLPIRRGALLLS
ncbi:UNVERIFIED_CONTAM: hypothetical protein FKN15_055772 [Acipenser sinensis]